MAYILDKEIMRKTFSMGENYDQFKHRPAQHIKIFPFPTNNNFTIVTSLASVVGEWLRLLRNHDASCASLEDTLAKISAQIDAAPSDRAHAVQIIKTLYWDEHDQLRPNSVNSMCYIPCTDSSELKIAHYLCSVLGDRSALKDIADIAVDKSSSRANVLEKLVLTALKADDHQGKALESYYTIHNAARRTFEQDLQFILSSATRTKEYLVDLLEFYYFFYTAQTSLTLSQFEYGNRNEIFPLYFSLDWEKTNKARDCYQLGWRQLETALEQQFYHAITLEILNQSQESKQYDYIAIKDLIAETGNEEEITRQIQKVCDIYRSAIRNISSTAACNELNSITRNDQLGPAFSEIHYLYDSVKCQFRNTDRGRVSDGYIKHFKTFCHEKFLKPRGANGLMLNITEEFLIFLTKITIKNEEQMSLNEVFHQFRKRGVYLDQPTKDEVVRFYTKLNLIDKKSDSGDAQYVKRIL